jgi:competence protein ComEC
LAVVGLSYFSGPIKNYLVFLPEQFDIRGITSATLSAQLLTYPLIIYYFSGFSPYSLLANLLVLPVVPFLMGWGIFNVSVAVVSLWLSRLLGLITAILVAYWVELSKFISLLPGSYLTISFSWPWLVLIYGLIGWCYLRLAKKKSR